LRKLFVEKFRPAGADAVGGFFVGHVGEVGVGVESAVGEFAGEAFAGVLGEEGVLFAPGEEGGLGDFMEAREVEGGGEIFFVGGEVAHHVHDAEAVVAVGEVADIAGFEVGVEAGFVDVADVLDAGDEFFGGRDGHEKFAQERDAGEAVHGGEFLGVAGGVGEEDFGEAGFLLCVGVEGGDEAESAAEGVAGDGESFCAEGVGDGPDGFSEGADGDAAEGPAGALRWQGERGVVDEGEVVGVEEVGGDGAEGGDGEAHAVLEDEEGARGGGVLAEEFERDEAVVETDGVDAGGAGVFDGGEFLRRWRVGGVEGVRGFVEFEPGPGEGGEVLRGVGHGGMMICGDGACNCFHP